MQTTTAEATKTETGSRNNRLAPAQSGIAETGQRLIVLLLDGQGMTLMVGEQKPRAVGDEIDPALSFQFQLPQGQFDPTAEMPWVASRRILNTLLTCENSDDADTWAMLREVGYIRTKSRLLPPWHQIRVQAQRLEQTWVLAKMAPSYRLRQLKLRENGLPETISSPRRSLSLVHWTKVVAEADPSRRNEYDTGMWQFMEVGYLTKITA